jgi:hypothetical protein
MDQVQKRLDSSSARRWRVITPVRLIGAGVLALTLGGCASLLGPRTVEISQGELLEKLSAQFPLSQRVLNVLDVQALTPRLTLHPDTNRVTATIPLVAKDVLRQRPQPGEVALSFGLRFEPQDLSIRLRDPRVESARLQGLPDPLQQGLTRLAAWMANERLNNQVVHRLKPEDLRSADRMGYVVHDLRVTASGLAVDLRPR